MHLPFLRLSHYDFWDINYLFTYKNLTFLLFWNYQILCKMCHFFVSFANYLHCFTLNLHSDYMNFTYKWCNNKTIKRGSIKKSPWQIFYIAPVLTGRRKTVFRVTCQTQKEKRNPCSILLSVSSYICPSVKIRQGTECAGHCLVLIYPW